ncbi:MAG: hypothetical protein BJ554DRAFT_6371 [Olpidium bornovanus]|uniref:BHLH domain-containing protein n=1 Tax=Olpidium bornovanus TaxID=278681 RepID=A0A8H8DK15_9FUNG|nr:MAG: hypothetical protein BJ554DRAFT_6371 [Olpidium bornovanus]
MACANHDGDAARQHGAGPPPGPNPLAPPSPPYAAAEAAPGQCDGRRTPPPFGRPSSPHVLDRHRHRGCRWPHVSSRCSSFAERSPVAPQPEKPPVVRTLSLPAAWTEGQDCGAHAPAACSPQNPVHASPPPAGCSGPCPAAAQQNCSRDDHHGARLYDSSTPSSSAPSPVPGEAEDEWRVRHYQSHTPAAGFQGTLPLPYEPAAAPQYPSPVSAPASPDFARPNPRQQLDAHAMLDRQRRRRENHNVVERRRRDTINNTIDDIAHALPARYLGGRKPNKGLVLKTAILYIEVGVRGQTPWAAVSFLFDGFRFETIPLALPQNRALTGLLPLTHAELEKGNCFSQEATRHRPRMRRRRRREPRACRRPHAAGGRGALLPAVVVAPKPAVGHQVQDRMRLLGERAAVRGRGGGGRRGQKRRDARTRVGPPAAAALPERGPEPRQVHAPAPGAPGAPAAAAAAGTPPVLAAPVPAAPRPQVSLGLERGGRHAAAAVGPEVRLEPAVGVPVAVPVARHRRSGGAAGGSRLAAVLAASPPVSTSPAGPADDPAAARHLAKHYAAPAHVHAFGARTISLSVA